MTSLKKIAAELGVSYTLVSKVLSGNLGTTGVSAATRQAIEDKAKELDYIPNRLAVALKSGKTGSIGVFLHGVGSPGSDVSHRLLSGLAEGLEKSGYRMWLRFFQTEEEFLAACDVKIRREVDGLIIAGAGHEELMPQFQKLEQEGVKVVTIFNNVAEKTTDNIHNSVVDNELQGFLPTKHLLDQGLRRIVCLDTYDERTRGFRRAFQEANVPLASTLILRCRDFMVEDGQLAAKEVMALSPQVEAVVCQSDAQAIGLINALFKQGIKVPEDIKVTGVDNSALGLICITPITTASSEMHQAGLNAVQMLLQSIAEEKITATKIAPRLIVRESSGG